MSEIDSCRQELTVIDLFVAVVVHLCYHFLQTMLLVLNAFTLEYGCELLDVNHACAVGVHSFELHS